MTENFINLILVDLEFTKDYISKYNLSNISKNEKLTLYINNSLEKNLNNYFREKGIKKGAHIYYYLSKDNNVIRELDIKQTVKKIKDLKRNKIIISSIPIEIKANDNKILTLNKEKINNELNEEKNKEKIKEDIEEKNEENIDSKNEGEIESRIEENIEVKNEKVIDSKNEGDIESKNEKNIEKNIDSKNEIKKEEKIDVKVEEKKEEKIKYKYLNYNDKDFTIISTTKELRKKTRNISNKKKSGSLIPKKSIIIIISSMLIIFIFIKIAIFLLLFKLRKSPSNPPKEPIKKPKEELMLDINYKEQQINLYRIEEKTNVLNEGKDQSNTTNFNEYKNYLLLIQEELEDSTGEEVKTYYSGIFSLYNSFIENKTHLILSQSDDKVNEIIEGKNQTINEKNFLDYHSNNDTNLFFKLNFYKNGEIKNIYIPENFNITNLIAMKELLSLTIPKLSKNYFVEDLEKEFNIISEEKNKEDNEQEEQENPNHIRNLNSNDENDTNVLINEPKVISKNSNEMDYNLDKMKLEKIVDEKNESYYKITEKKFKNVNDEYVTMEGGSTNSSIIFYLNEKTGKLEIIEEISRLFLSGENNDDSIKMDKVFDNNNLIKYDEMYKDISQKTPSLEPINFIVDTNKVVNFDGTINDKSIYNKLLSYFNKYKYSEYNEKEYKSKVLRQLKEYIAKKNNLNPDDIIIHKNDRRLRKISESSNEESYYGLKNFTDSREAYETNIMGIKLNQKVYTKFDPSTGIIYSSVDINFGKITFPIIYPKYHTNLNIIIQNINQLNNNLIHLMLDTNSNLGEKNSVLATPIKEMEIDSIRMLKSYDDFSNVLKDPLDNIYNEIKNFTSDSFIALIDLIKSIHDAYSSLINNIKKNKYEKFIEIREITKSEYLNYIINMTNILENFYNNTLNYINDLYNELSKINDFQIDILYDIIDSINNCKEIYESFNKKLFNSIEKGIIYFKYDLNKYLENIIGDLLYVTDFLSININQNEILIKEIEEKDRNKIQILLKGFRIFINEIIEYLINNIQKDYEYEISETNENSIKSKNVILVNNLLYKIIQNSTNLIDEIKTNIKFINLYELYQNNIDIIDKINNKTISEFNSEFYEGCLKQMINIKPDFYENNTEIINYKNKLFNLSVELKNEENKEISEINNYIIDFSKNYFKDNLYKIYNNLYNIRKLFMDNEMNNLLNKFEKKIKYIINEKLKGNIYYNYYFGMNYLK